MPLWTTRIRAARAALGMSQRELAAAANLGVTTVVDLEADGPVKLDHAIACQEILEGEGIEFWELGPSAGFFLRGVDAVDDGALFAAGRAALSLSQAQMAELAGIHLRTIAKVENGTSRRPSVADKYRDALVASGVTFLNIDGRRGIAVSADREQSNGSTAVQSSLAKIRNASAR